jgi:hypothetical protein
MGEKFNLLIKSSATQTVPAAETKSIGLAAIARVSWFLQTNLDSFIVTRQLLSTYRDLVSSRQIIVTRDLSTIYRDLQKPSHRDVDGNSPNRRAVRFKISVQYRDIQRTSKSLAACHRACLCCCQTHAFLPTMA